MKANLTLKRNGKEVKNITREVFEKWLEKNRPHPGAHETIWGNKGVYDLSAGPAASFENRGKTWREVLTSLAV